MVVLNTAEESSTRATLQIEVPAEDVDKTFRSVRRAYAKRAAIPGFRKGHAPESVVEKRFSGEIREDVLERLLPEALASAVEEKKLAVLGRPRIEDLTWEPPGPIRFTARLDLKPPVDPGPHRGIPVHEMAVEPTEEDIARVIDRIREGHAEFHPLEGRPAAAGDFAVVDVAGTFVEILEPGQNPRTFRDEKLTLEVGHADSMPEINDALRGAFPAETRRFRKSFPDEFPNDQFRGKTVDYAVTLVALKEKKLPEFNDELARLVGENETAAGLREKVAHGIRHDKQIERRRRMRREILDVLLSRTAIPAPEVLVDAEVHAALRDYARYLEASGADPKEADWAKLREDARPGAERRVREYLVLDEVARREQVSVTDTELDAEIKRAAARRGVEPGQLREQMAAADGLEPLRDEIRLGKTVDLLISAAQVLPAEEGVKRETEPGVKREP
jgi:trigger factor